MRGEEGEADCVAALGTLYEVLYTLTKLMAPFTPFLTEAMYQNLRHGLVAPEADHDVSSVHYLPAPQHKEEYFDDAIIARVTRMQAVVELARVVRERKTLPVKYPLGQLVVLHADKGYLADIEAMAPYIQTELNVRDVVVSSDEQTYGLSLRAEPDLKVLGKRLGADLKSVRPAVMGLSEEQCRAYIRDGELTVAGHTLAGDDIKVIRVFADQGSAYESNTDNDVVILLDCTQRDDMVCLVDSGARSTNMLIA